MSTLKKAAVIGATAYGAYQLGKLSGSFGSYHHGGHWGYREWNNWREVDGFMCRNSQDCNWIDPRLYCQDYELDFSPTRAWFGGDFAAIIGECACPHGMRWDDWDMKCEYSMMSFIGGVLGLIGIVAGVILCCCCCAACIFARRFFS